MRAILLFALLAACTEDRPRPPDSELHAIGTCSGWGGPPDSCEAPCAKYVFPRDPPLNTLGNACVSHWPTADGQADWGCTESSLWEYKGVLGCCAQKGNDPSAAHSTVHFAVCEGE